MGSSKRLKPIPLLRLALSYLSLLLVIILLGGSMFLAALNAVTKQTVNTVGMFLDPIAIRIGSFIDEANYFCYTVNRLPSIAKLMQGSASPSNDEVSLIREATQSLSSFEDSGGLVAGYQVYLSRSDLILEPGNCCRDIEWLYGKSFGFDALTAMQWRSEVLQARESSRFYPMQDMKISMKNGRMLVYTRSLTNVHKLAGKMIFYVDGDALQELFHPLTKLFRGSACLLENDGQMLVHSGGLSNELGQSLLNSINLPSGSRIDIAGDDQHIVFSHRIPSINCTLMAAIPFSAILRQTSGVLKPMLIAAVLMVLLGLGLTFFSISKTRKPLVNTMALLSKNDDGSLAQKGLNQLHQAVNQLVSSHTMLSERLKEQRAALRMAVVASLESGDTLDDRELDILLSHVGIKPEGDRFRGVYLTLSQGEDIDSDELEQEDIRRALISELLKPYEPRLLFLSLKDRSGFILLYSENSHEDVDLTRFFSDLYNACKSVEDMEPHIYVGSECSKLCYLPHSLLSARKLMLSDERNAFLSIADASGGTAQSYLYTEQHEKKLTALAVMGREEELLALLDDIYEQNMLRQLSRFNGQLLFFRMVGTLSGVMEETDLPQELTFSLHKLTMDQFFALLKASYQKVCQNNRSKHTARTAQLIQNILSYLDQNCTDPSLSLASTALHFGITEKYLSSFIHEKSGINFSTYVERLRIAKANELLASTDLSFVEISQRVGYTNVKTFRRAYIRTEGVAPSEARRMQSV